MLATPQPLVTMEALQAFTDRLVAHFSPEKVSLFGSLARGEARWDSDADLLLWRPEEAFDRYQQGDPFLREAFERGQILHG